MIKISIVIPTYNMESSISNAVISVLNQTYTSWEIIVVDDGSSDDTAQIIDPYLEDRRVHYLKTMNQGVCTARNRGASMTKGEYLIFLDADDQLTETALGDFFSSAVENPLSDVFIGGYIHCMDSKQIKRYAFPNKYNNTLSGTFMIKKSFFERLNGYDTSLKYAENTELFFRIAQINARVTVVNYLTLKYFESKFGGSKNNLNKIDSLKRISHKHKGFLSPHIQRLYHQIIGVCLLREAKYKEASAFMWTAYKLNPTKIDTFSRWVIAKIPLMARIIYPPNK